MSKKEKNAKEQKGLETRLIKTTLNHIYNFDINADGRYREVAVVKRTVNPNKTISAIHYIDVALMDNIDKSRLKGVITGLHADKYDLWDLLSQQTLSNGKNALDYFHQLVKVEYGEGAVNTGMGGGLGAIAVEKQTMVGAEFSDPTSGVIDN